MEEIFFADSNYYILDWEDIVSDVEKLSEEVQNIKPTVLVGPLRWGAVVAGLLSDYLNMSNIYSLGCKLYIGLEETKQKVDIYQPLSLPSLKGEVVLITDDVSDTGKTLRKVKSLIEKLHPYKVYTSTLHIKPWTRFTPDFFVREINGWIIYPWSRIESLKLIFGKLEKEGLTKNEMFEAVIKFFPFPKETVEKAFSFFRQESLKVKTLRKEKG